LTCLDTDTVCAAARAGTESGAANNNNSRAMRYVDVDGDPRTFDSSAATLALPPGGRVAFAGLYYGGRSLAGTGGQAAPNAAQRGQVLFRPPGLDDYLTLQADTVDNVVDPTGLEREYQGFVDVTDIVRSRTLRLVVRAKHVRHTTRVVNVAALRHAGRLRHARARVRILPLAAGRCAARPSC
jgi:hypothetical protein